MSEKKIEKLKSDKKEVKVVTKHISFKNVPQARPMRPKHDSMTAIGDLVQCSMCLSQVRDPRMLPCQHTFCLSCLRTQLSARSLQGDGNNQPKLALKRSLSLEPKINCPVCNREYALADGYESLEQLPKNLHVESLLKILEVQREQKENNNGLNESKKCFRCRKEEEEEKDRRICQHCDQTFCCNCWKDHLQNLEFNLGDFAKRLDDSESKLIQKIEDFEIRCDRIDETVKEVIQQKIAELEKIEKDSLREIASMKREANLVYETLNDRVKVMKKKIENNEFKEGTEVRTYLDLQKEATKLLTEIGFFGEAKVGFNPDTLRLEQYEEDIYNIEDAKKTVVKLNPLESLETMVKFFQTKNFKPKVIWNKCPRPGGLGIPPWDQSLLLVSAPDARCVFVLERGRLRLIRRLRHDALSTPTGICFCAERKVTYVADARSHVVHVFGPEGDHLGTVGDGVLRAPHGVATSVFPNELAVCDSGHDRVVLIDVDSGSVRLVLDGLKRPEGVAVTTNGRVVVADTGNDAIKLFDGRDGRLVGAVPTPRPSAVGVGPFDVIGARGAADRPLLMTAEGVVVETRGHAQKEAEQRGHASGLVVTPELDVLVADAVARKLVVF